MEILKQRSGNIESSTVLINLKSDSIPGLVFKAVPKLHTLAIISWHINDHEGALLSSSQLIDARVFLD